MCPFPINLNVKVSLEDADFFENRGQCEKWHAIDRLFLRPNLDFMFFVPCLGKSNERLAFRLLSYTAIKRLLLSLALAMFNNYNGRCGARE